MNLRILGVSYNHIGAKGIEAFHSSGINTVEYFGNDGDDAVKEIDKLKTTRVDVIEKMNMMKPLCQKQLKQSKLCEKVISKI